nr:reverse transcriptase domain-containing protein [Tanacetum cinerariifolium]
MQTRSSSRLISNPSSNLTPSTKPNSKGRNRRRSKQRIEEFNLEELSPPIFTMADQRTMAQLLQAPTEGHEDAIVVPAITAHNFVLKHVLLTLIQNKQFFGHDKEDPHAHILYFNKITSTLKFPNISNTSIKLMLFPFSLEGAARIWQEKKPPQFIFTWDYLVSKFINQLFPPSKLTNLRNEITNFQQRFDESFSEAWDRFKDLLRAYPHHGFSELHQLDTFYNALNSKDQDSLNSTIGGLFSLWVKANDAVMRNMQTHGQNMKNQLTNLIDLLTKFMNSNSASTSNLGTLPSNTIANPRSDLKAITTRSGVSYDGPQILPLPSFLPKVVENEPDATKDTVHPTNNESTKDVQPLVVQSESLIHISEPVNSPIIEHVASPPINQSLLTNKDKLCELARTPQNQHCSAVLLKKLPKKLGDPDKFLIPCDFPEKAECLALADLGASINLMPLSMWNKLYLPDLSLTCMTLELIDRSISRPVGVAEDVYIKVGTFHFSSDFVVIDFEANPRVHLILGRSFLKTGRALIDVFEGELTLRVGKEATTFNLNQTSRYSANYNDMTAKRIDVIDMACEEFSQEVIGFSNVITSGNPTPYYNLIVSTTYPTLTLFKNSYFLLEEADAFLALEDDPTSPEVDQSYLDYEGDILLLGSFLNDDPSLPPPNQGNYRPEVCTFQRCMMAIFHDMIEKTMEVFMDDFSVFRNSLQSCLSHLEKMLKRCEDTKLCLNWEKTHFMVKEGIVLGHKISKEGIKVNKAKVDVITKLPHPTTIKGIQSFLDHTGFYHHFINDFSIIARSMTRLLEKDTPFHFSKECVDAYQKLKRKLTEAPILIAPDWDMSFELCAMLATLPLVQS